MDEDILDLIDLAFIEGQINGETVDLIYLLQAGGPQYNPFRETPTLTPYLSEKEPNRWRRAGENFIFGISIDGGSCSAC